ncbi:WbqC family protein [Streptomyces tendae]|uniref:WbqC family protein n=1 Tax=Streptomyces tendae TaxID=1932 RepID=UPI0036474436
MTCRNRARCARFTSPTCSRYWPLARRDYQHRAHLGALDAPSRQQWLTVPTRLPQGRPTLIRDALIVDLGRARRKTMEMLRQHYGAGPHWPALADLLDRVLDAFDRPVSGLPAGG